MLQNGIASLGLAPLRLADADIAILSMTVVMRSITQISEQYEELNTFQRSFL